LDAINTPAHWGVLVIPSHLPLSFLVQFFFALATRLASAVDFSLVSGVISLRSLSWVRPLEDVERLYMYLVLFKRLADKFN
jgi:hypothetical protein